MHLEHLPSGKWRAVVSVNGRRRSVSAPTKAEARQRGAELSIEMGDTPRDRIPVFDIIDAHLAAADIATTTMTEYQRVRRKIPDTFGNRIAADVTSAVIDSLYRQLIRDGWSPHTVRRLHDLLSKSFERAVRYDWARVDPTNAVRPPRVDTADITPPDASEVAKLLAAAPPDLSLFLRLAATTGARRGALVALQWDDVRFDSAELVFRRVLRYTPDSGVTIAEGKSGRKEHRVISIGLPTVVELRRHRAEMVEAAVAHGHSPTWVFSHTLGLTPWRPDYPTLTFGRLRAKLGLQHVRLHDLRHFVATEMLAAGDSAVAVAGRLGHSNPATTLRVYAHWVQAQDRTAADRLDSQFG